MQIINSDVAIDVGRRQPWPLPGAGVVRRGTPYRGLISEGPNYLTKAKFYAKICRGRTAARELIIVKLLCRE